MLAGLGKRPYWPWSMRICWLAKSWLWVVSTNLLSKGGNRLNNVSAFVVDRIQWNLLLKPDSFLITSQDNISGDGDGESIDSKVV